jgi:hypothetical protein
VGDGGAGLQMVSERAGVRPAGTSGMDMFIGPDFEPIAGVGLEQLVPGLSLEASVDPADPGAVCLDLGSLN